MSKLDPFNTLAACLLLTGITGRAAESDGSLTLTAAGSYQDRVAAVTKTPGLVAFWDFTKREAPVKRFTAHVPAGEKNDYALDAGNYVKDRWNTGPSATYADFPMLGSGPFGQAIRIKAETNPDFRPLLFVPRARLHDTPLDIKGAGKGVTIVVWAIRESGNHALAGIWPEDGRRQYALFAGLNKEGTACGHVSENGRSSFLNSCALHKCNSAEASPKVPSDSTVEVLAKSWQTFAMTFDNKTQELTGWLNGQSGDRWLDHPQQAGMISAANAWLQGRLAKIPGLQDDEDPKFPAAQYYNPPEESPVKVTVIDELGARRLELREYRYTKVKVTLLAGQETQRELVALRLNPWWYPHGIFEPKNDGTGGPFTIGRVLHGGRSVGFTGWIGGVAVFDRALTAEELAKLNALARTPIQGM